jgi:tetratricopeptide (TPR) repeat protein
VRAALDQVRALREEVRRAPERDKWVRARARAREQVERALTLVESGPVEEALAAQVRQEHDELNEEERDHRLVGDLEAASLVQSEIFAGENRFAPERAIPQFREAFRSYGMPVGTGDPAAAAARLRRRSREVRQVVGAAVEQWLEQAIGRPDRVNEPHLDWLRAFAAGVLDEGGMPPELRAALHDRDSTRRRAALERLAAGTDVRQSAPRALAQLAWRLQTAGSNDSAARLLRRAWRQHPEDFWVNEQLGLLLLKSEPPSWQEALHHLMAAVALRPDSPGARINLGLALEAGGQREEAVACYRRAVELSPKYAVALSNLGGALLKTQQLDEAIACYRQALALDPTLATAHCNLGHALHEKGQVDEAIVCYRRAIALEPGCAWAHSNLGSALSDKDKLDEAIASYRKAIDLDPRLAEAHFNLGKALRDKGQLDEAMACYRKAIALDPKLAEAHVNLGNLLQARRRLDESIACYRKAIALDPRLFNGHVNLGTALASKGDFRAALASLRTGQALRRPGEGPAFPLAELIKRCERCVRLDDLLVAVQKGKARPSGPAECLELADFCRQRKQSPAAAVRFYTEAFTAEPKLAADLPAAHRYHAAQSAALAGCGQGQDAGKLDAGERGRLRQRALDWLRADLTLRGKQLDSGQGADRADVQQKLRHWQQDSALAGIRDRPALDKLPAAEQKAFARLWSDVAALLAKTAAPK